MDTIRLSDVCELRAVICLDHFRQISEECDCAANKIASRVAALLFIGIEESFSGGLFYDCVLVE